MNYHIVKKSFFDSKDGENRLDAEYAEKDLCEIEEKHIAKTNAKPISIYCDPYDGRTIKKGSMADDSVFKYIPIDSVDNADGLVLSRELLFSERPSRAKYEVQKNNIIVSNVRPNRNTVALIGSREENNIASSGFTLLKVKEESPFSPEFLFIFFKTQFAINQLIRRNRGSMYPAVIARDVLSCIIPNLPQKFIGCITKSVKEGLEKREKFFNNLDQAEEKLYTYLSVFGSPPSPMETRKEEVDYTIVNRSDFYQEGGALRFDAEFFRSEYDEYDSKIKAKSKVFTLGDYYEMAPGNGLGKPKKDIVFFKQSCLSNYGINWSAIGMEMGTLGKGESDVRVDDILLACTAHEVFYVGRKVDLVRALPEGLRENRAVCDLLVIRAKEEKPAWLPNSYVASFLRSDAGRHQVQRCIRGLRGGHVYARDLIRFVRIPIPNENFLHEYEGHISEAEVHKNESKEIIRECISRIEKVLHN